jgi:arylsulfatase A-like enzyme
VKPAGVCDQLVHQADLIATLAAILGTRLPDNAAEDSFSLLPLLRGSDRPVRENAVSCAASGVPALRLGRWKLIAGTGGGSFGQSRDDNTVKLYDLTADPGETRNLTAEQPERVATMRALLEKLIAEGRSTPGARQNNDVEVRRHPVAAAATSAAKSKRTKQATR